MRLLGKGLIDLRLLSTSTTPSLTFSNRRFLSSTPSFNAKETSLKVKDAKHAYSKTLNLPRTPFPLKADAAKREMLFRSRTTKELYDWQSKQLERPLFILHDGPPYANGNLHIGHALNKILKDLINRSKLLQGFRIHYVPGYDTHGLPLELKALSALKLPASSLSPQVIRSAARKEAEKGVDLQEDEFIEFGCIGAFGKGEGYKTMDWSYEKRQLGVVREMVRKGLITTHHRPTIYSPSSRTALAEAELEYREDHESRSVYVAFPISNPGKLAGIIEDYSSVSLAAWTTTAWTLPSNVALAVSNALEYALVQDMKTQKYLIVGCDRIAALEEILETTLRQISSFPGTELLETTYTSPFDSNNITISSSPRPIISAPYVTATTGTGIVHTSPAHGVEDFDAWTAYEKSKSIDIDTNTTPQSIVCTVDGEGKFNKELKGLIGDDILERLVGLEVLGKAPGVVIEILEERGTLLKEVKIQHKYPYDWRTKKPVIFRASSQWFANLEIVKEDAIKAIDNVTFYPPQGRKTLEIFVRGRSEWCISRQRAWGVPIPVVYSYKPGSDPLTNSTPYISPSNIDHIISVLDLKGKGTDYWWEGTAEEFVEAEELIRSKLEGLLWRKGTDTLDVWFDSGVSWTCLKEFNLRPSTGKDSLPLADVYIEGSDQHRGWFQSSLLTSVSASEEGEVPKAPYGTVITHGMVLDDKGRKMSKSLGNVTSPLAVIKGGKDQQKEPAYGTDLLRIWVASVDSSGDVPIGPSILAQTSEGLRKIRNSARFMLLNLNGEEILEFETKELGFVERYILNELYVLDQKAREGYNAFAFNRVYQALSSFSNITLSSLYYGVVKDALYTDSKSNPSRQKIIHTLRKVLDTYTSILAPMAPHLAEEILHYASGGLKDPPIGEVNAGSIFEKGWTPVDESFNDPTVKAEMDSLLVIREQVTKLLEQARTADVLKTSVEAEIVISNAPAILKKHHDILNALFNVSNVHFVEGSIPLEVLWQYSADLEKDSKITIIPSPNEKCPRCWSHTRKIEEEVCNRCHSVLASVV